VKWENSKEKQMRTIRPKKRTKAEREAKSLSIPVEVEDSQPELSLMRPLKRLKNYQDGSRQTRHQHMKQESKQRQL
jgi:hypothetical protein